MQAEEKNTGQPADRELLTHHLLRVTEQNMQLCTHVVLCFWEAVQADEKKQETYPIAAHGKGAADHAGVA